MKSLRKVCFNKVRTMTTCSTMTCLAKRAKTNGLRRWLTTATVLRKNKKDFWKQEQTGFCRQFRSFEGIVWMLKIIEVRHLISNLINDEETDCAFGILAWAVVFSYQSCFAQSGDLRSELRARTRWQWTSCSRLDIPLPRGRDAPWIRFLQRILGLNSPCTWYALASLQTRVQAAAL